MSDPTLTLSARVTELRRLKMEHSRAVIALLIRGAAARREARSRVEETREAVRLARVQFDADFPNYPADSYVGGTVPPAANILPAGALVVRRGGPEVIA